MIDIHCHILPDFDDGAESLEEALDMARMAAATGVTDIVATPHFQGEPGTLELLPLMQRQFRVLSSALTQAHIPVQLHPGAEVLCLPDTISLAVAHQLPTLAGTNYVLSEFYFDESYSFMDETLSEIADCGYKPVIAHPERYDVIQRDPRLLHRWARQGFVIQMNKGSVLGSFGSRVEQTANEILAMGLAHLFASDAHSCERRTPNMEGLYRWTEEFCDEECARMLLVENPGQILQGLPIVAL
jgi:protein-tyrosine phosphatase